MLPPTVKKFCGAIGRPISGKHSRKHGIHIASQTQPQILITVTIIASSIALGCITSIVLLLTIIPIMPITQEIVSQWRSVKQCLQHRIHKTSVSQIVQSSQSPWQIGQVRTISPLSSLQWTRVSSHQDSFPQIRCPRPIIDPPPFPQILRRRRGSDRTASEGGRSRLRNHHRGVEVPVVDLVATRTTE